MNDFTKILLILARRARNRGQEPRLIELLTHHPEAARQIAAFVESREQGIQLAATLSPEAIEALTLCGLTVGGGTGQWDTEAVAGLTETKKE